MGRWVIHQGFSVTDPATTIGEEDCFQQRTAPEKRKKTVCKPVWNGGLGSQLEAKIGEIWDVEQGTTNVCGDQGPNRR